MELNKSWMVVITQTEPLLRLSAPADTAIWVEQDEHHIVALFKDKDSAEAYSKRWGFPLLHIVAYTVDDVVDYEHYADLLQYGDGLYIPLHPDKPVALKIQPLFF